VATTSLITDAPDHRPSNIESTALLAGEGRTSAGTGLKRFMWLLAALSVIGFVGIVFRFINDDGRQDWGFYAATLAWMLTIFGGAPMVAIAPALAKADWVRPVARIASLGAIVTAIIALLMIPLLFKFPALTQFSEVLGDDVRRRSIWFDSPSYAPHFWNVLILLTLALVGMAMAYVMAIPDFAAIRDHGTGWKQRWGKKLARGFYGRQQQWEWLKMRIGITGALYFAMLLYTNFTFSLDFAVSLVPGWKDSLFPFYHTITTFQAGIAFTIIGVWAARRWGGMNKYVGHEQMWSLGKFMLATTLLWFYFFYSSFIVFWYGRSDSDSATIKLLVSGPYIYLFWTVFFLVFIIPWWIMIWNKVRDSVWGPPIAAFIILFGLFLDRIRIYVSSWSAVPDDLELATTSILQDMPDTMWPDVFDVFIMVGLPALGLLSILLVTRLVPLVSLWEIQQSRLITKPVRFLRSHVQLVGKPD
jgi:Ni/Fe-hydrogenase subunit HybB-like protein